MTNRITPTAKTLLAAALTVSAVLGLSACGSSSKTAAAAAANANPAAAAATTAAVGAPVTNQTQPAAGPTATAPASAATGSQPQNPTNPPNVIAATKTKPTTAPKPPTSKPTKPAKPTTSSTDTDLAPACPTTSLKGTVTAVNRPINHVLLTVTNTGKTTCSVYYYPDLRLDADQQSVTQPVEDSKPQAVVTIQPGESAYAGIGTAAADGSGGTPRLEKQVDVYLEAGDQSGSLPGSLTLPLPAGTYVDVDKAFVTYWQYDLQSALTW